MLTDFAEYINLCAMLMNEEKSIYKNGRIRN